MLLFPLLEVFFPKFTACNKVSPVLPANAFQVLDVRFLVFDPFWVEFVRGEQWRSSFLLLCVNIYPSFAVSFIEGVVLFPVHVFGAFVENQLAVETWIYFWISILFCWLVYLFLCQYHAVLVTMTFYILKSHTCDVSSLILFIQYCFEYLGSFVLLCEF